MQQFLTQIIILIVAAFLGGFFARSISLTPIVGYILSGAIFSFLGKTLFPSYSSLLSLSSLGVSLLLFTLGFEISFEKIKKINKEVIILGFIHVFFISLLLFPLLFFFDFDFKQALLLSVVFSFSSTAVVVKILEEKGLLTDFPGNSVFVLLLIQDILVVPAIFFLPMLFQGTEATGLSTFLQVFSSSIKALVIFLLIFFLSKFLLPKISNILYKYPSHELNILATIFISVLSIMLFTMIGLPQGIAAFLAGVLISEEGKNLAPLSEIRPLRDIFLVLFFILTGMLVDVPFVATHFVKILSITAIVLFVKFFVVYSLFKFAGFVAGASVFIASYLANIGEFAVVIGQFLYSSNLIGKETYNIILSVFVLSLVSVPFWANVFREKFFLVSKLKIFRRFFTQGDLLQAGYSRVNEIKDHVVICGHGRVGKQIRSLLDFAGVPYVVIDFNRKIVSDLLSQNKLAIYGDPSDEDVLRGSCVERAKVLVVAVPDFASQKKIIKAAVGSNPKILILARSHQEDDRYKLANLGVNSIVIPEFEAGVKIGTKVLEIFGLPAETISYFVKGMRKENLT